MAKIGTRTGAQLTAPSTWTAWLPVGDILPSSADVEVTIASINTNVTVKLQYSDDGSTISSEGMPQTITNTMGPLGTGNGKYDLHASLVRPFVRAYFVSETGGTAVTIDTALSGFTN